MFNRILLLPLVLASLACGVQSVQGRLLENWPYDKLFKQADVVVIARAKSTEDADDRSKENPWKVEFLGQTTTLTVKFVLKGKPEGESIKVLHYKLKEGSQIVNGPCFVSFRTKSLLLEGKEYKASIGPPDYLLFLKLRKDGRYEAVSGQVDPALSVREMYEPLRDLSEK